MALFQFKNKTIHYQLISNSVPSDTLFVHGNLSSGRWFEPTIKAMQKMNFAERHSALLSMDWLGCGKSSAPENESDLEMASMARDLIELVSNIGLDEVNLVGHSTGGLIVLEALLQAPNLFKSAVLLDSVSAKGIQFGPEMYEAFTQMSQNRELCGQIMASTIHNCPKGDSFIESLFDDTFKVNAKIWHGIPNVLNRTDIREKIKAINHSVLVLHGEFDTLLPKEGSKELAKLLPNAKYMEIAGQGHCTNIEAPEKFAKILADFFYQD